MKTQPSKLANWFFPLLVAATTGFAFFPALSNGFVTWDDPDNLIKNVHYQGLHWVNIKWMLTSFYMGVYIPLTWITFSLDYLVWKLNPFGFHLTNIVLHGMSAVLVYHIAYRLLNEDPGRSLRLDSRLYLSLASAIAALCFAIHPLRVESVAWATERRDVLSCFFFLWTILFYLKEAPLPTPQQDGAWIWRWASIAAYALSLLAKATGITLPFLLLVIDVYRYQQINVNGGRAPFPWKRCLYEKLPYFVLALPIAIVAMYGQKQDMTMAPVGLFDLRMRIAVASHSVLFYLWKTLWPIHLSPLNPLPDLEALHRWPYTAYPILVVLVSVLLAKKARQVPALCAAWLWYLIALFPVSGFFQCGWQLTADRYSYFPSLSWAVLLGGCFLQIMHHPETPHARFYGIATGTVALLLGWVILTRQQIRIWHDTLSLWSHVVRLHPESVSARNNVGAALAEQGRLEEAVKQFQFALQMDPGHEGARNNLKKALDLLRKQHSSLHSVNVKKL